MAFMIGETVFLPWVLLLMFSCRKKQRNTY